MGSDFNVTNTTNGVKPNFWSRVGKWFNKNGDTVGKVMQATGDLAMGVGLTGLAIHEMNRPHSIWGCGFNSGYYGSFWGSYPGFMNNTSLFCNPFNRFNTPFMGGYNDLANTQSFMLGYHMGTQQNWRT